MGGCVIRTYGRVGQTNGWGGTWTEVTTDANGDNSNVYLTAIVQTLKLNLGESPLWGNSGIPAVQSVMTQIAPDYYAAQTQAFYASKFASLAITRIPGSFHPTYTVRAVCFSGAILETEVPT